MAKPLTLPPLSDTQVIELRQLYDTTTKAKLRLRAYIILLVHQGRSVAEIAAIILRSRDTVERVLRRFLHGGIAALPPRTAPGRAPTVTSAVEIRTPAGDRPRPADGRSPQCPLDDQLLGHVSGGHHQRRGHCRDRTLVSTCRWRSLQAAALDPQTQSRSAPGLRGKRLRGEVILAGAG